MNTYKFYLTIFCLSFFLGASGQNAVYNSVTTNSLKLGNGASDVYGWGVATDNSLDPRPNVPSSSLPYMINYHTGLTLSAHSFYGGIRFYNQDYPSTFGSNAVMVMSIVNGRVGIGTTDPDSKLSVNGLIHAKEVKIDLSFPAPDYVFDESYNLKSLAETAQYIKENKHLPDVPSAVTMAKEGINLSELNMALLKKVEELTLYLIEKDKKDIALQLQVDELKAKLENITAKPKGKL